MSETKTLTGGCHCGAFRFDAKTDLSFVVSCNCSICSKRASLLTFVDPSSFRLTHGDESKLTDYQFNKHVIHHLFCPTCGISSFARGQKPDGTPMVAINLRCADDLDTSKLAVTPFDGKSR